MVYHTKIHSKNTLEENNDKIRERIPGYAPSEDIKRGLKSSGKCTRLKSFPQKIHVHPEAHNVI